MSSQPWLDDAYANAVAVIGMSGRFRNAPDLHAYWLNLKNGFEAARRLTQEELQANGCQAGYAAHPAFVPACAQMEDVDLFDAAFFGFSPGEAREMDPQLRLMFESAWHAFENAGYVPGDVDLPDTRVGVFAGAAPSSYWLCNVGPDAFNNTGTAFHRSAIVNGQDFLSTWISYKFGLSGPSLNIQTACSTGLVLVATACQHLLDYSCDMALAVTASVINPRGWGYVAESGGILAPDGHCRPFDAAAGGTLPGEGTGAVILKRLEDAITDGDDIKAVIRGYGLNNDGSRKAGFSAPSADGQAAAVLSAQRMACLDSRDIGYVETHGTGTYLGDPIEIAGLAKVFHNREIPCMLGSLKGNLGHLGNAAGMASLIKTVLMLQHDYVPPTINFRTLNPEIDFDADRFRIVTQGEPWPGELPRVAGVSAFGFGGTNCHVIIERTPDWAKTPTPSSVHPQVGHAAEVCGPLLLSAPEADGLRRLMERWGLFLKEQPHLGFSEVAWNARHGRKLFSHRCAVWAKTPREAGSKLLDGDVYTSRGPVTKEAPHLLLVCQDDAERQTMEQLAGILRKYGLSPVIMSNNAEPVASGQAVCVILCDGTGIPEELKNIVAARNISVFQWLTVPADEFSKQTSSEILPRLLGELFLAGLNPCLPRNGASRLELPEYPFARESHWLALKIFQSEDSAYADTAQATSSAEDSTAEELVLEIWREAFGIPTLKADDDFYVMGGTSMTAVQILADIEGAFGLRLPMTEFNGIRTPLQLLDKLTEMAE